MADPIIPRGLRAQLVLEGDSGLPEDRFVTTWAFQSTASPATEADADVVATRLQEWLTVAPPGEVSLSSHLGPHCNGAGVVKVYLLDDPPPRAPFEYDFSFTAPVGTALPAECAVTASFYSFVNVPRSRGRVYFGPLAAMSGTFVEGDSRPTPALREALVGACLRLASYGAPLWCVLSGADGDLKPITNGWVDNAFDTQRRRGLDPSARDSWGLP